MATRVERASREIPDWLKPQLAWIVGPSWALSAVFHVLTALVVWQVSQSPGCRADVRGEQIGEGREVGIFVRPGNGDGTGTGDGGGGSGGDGGNDRSVTSQSVSSSTDDASTSDSTLDQSPVALSLPQAGSAGVLGLGAPPSFAQKAARAAAGATGASNGTGGGPGGFGNGGSGRGFGTGGGGIGSTSMFGVTAKGRKFVYVIDCSSSMDVTLRAAKGELLASIQRLDESQQFQVVFFNSLPRTLSTRFNMFRGADAHRLDAREQILEITADGGTNRLPALEKAFEFSPDVIYFLTDSEAGMSARDLEDVRRYNRSGAQIHCVEFGEGPEKKDPMGRPIPNFLHKLAAATGGQYAYRDVNQLGQP